MLIFVILGEHETSEMRYVNEQDQYNYRHQLTVNVPNFAETADYFRTGGVITNSVEAVLK